MMKHAVETGLRADDPTRDVRAIRVKSEGFHSWTDTEIAQFEKRHPIGSRSRLALALLLYTGQRRSDVVRMGRQHIHDGVLHIRQQKTGAELAIPVHPDLGAIVAETAADHLTFLTTQFGQSFKAAGFGNWFREQCDAAGLKHCSAHGLRKAAARRLAEAGCTEHEIAAITGHASLREVARYTKAADQKWLAAAAMEKGQSANNKWQTCLKVCQKREEPMRNQRENLEVAPRAGFEPATNRSTDGSRTGSLTASDRPGVCITRFWESNLRRSVNNAGSEPPQPTERLAGLAPSTNLLPICSL
jgi:hypothetical protein